MSNAGPVTAFIALGSNLGNSRGIIEAAFACLQDLSIAPVRRSSLWQSEPVDCPPGSPKFINAAAAIVPSVIETPESLLAKLQALEREFGRQPKQVMNEARPLDLDLIAFGAEVRKSASLTLPHPRAVQRAFVLMPLAELAPEMTLPGQSVTIAKLVSLLSDTTIVTRL